MPVNAGFSCLFSRNYLKSGAVHINITDNQKDPTRMQKQLLIFTCVFYLPACLATTNEQIRKFLGAAALPIHIFLTTKLDNKTTTVNSSVLREFIKTFKKWDVAPTILCDLPDKREAGEYQYHCPEGQEYRVVYKDRSGAYQPVRIRGNEKETVHGLPQWVVITKGGKRRTINFIDNSFSANFSAKKSYDLLELLFACDRITEVQKILCSTEKTLAIPRIMDAFQESYERCPGMSTTEQEASLELIGRFRHDDEPDDCNCCMTTGQVCCCLTLLATPGGKEHAAARWSYLALMAIAQTIKSSRGGPQLSKKKKD